jgi:hypothetical protein
MELTPLAWLLVVLALILGFLVAYFRFKPQVPPLLNGGKSIKLGESFNIPDTGGTLNFDDASPFTNGPSRESAPRTGGDAIESKKVGAASQPSPAPTGNKFQIQLPKQIPPRAIKFTNVKLDNWSLSSVPNPGHKRVRRVIIKLTAEDEKGPVEYFYPMMTTVWNYTKEDVDHAGGDPNTLRRFYHNTREWIELGMPKNALDTKNQTLTAFVATFSSCGGGN